MPMKMRSLAGRQVALVQRRRETALVKAGFRNEPHAVRRGVLAFLGLQQQCLAVDCCLDDDSTLRLRHSSRYLQWAGRQQKLEPLQPVSGLSEERLHLEAGLLTDPLLPAEGGLPTDPASLPPVGGLNGATPSLALVGGLLRTDDVRQSAELIVP
eukprot:CAMPEP_0113232970 /NCGR_PEP_ID=MMETSP0008_2-20120614/2233_1 /TAXON_ID=97485 /ORGANISM="Prymnesium parvum" /LENGTH=154 /DNA_ID=CAMNT_0000079719 /DNA_START=70 /DNA_END=533 /DNA_ORIENTATION=- /assembly_acc=CAM_ASM_000153